MALTRNPIHVGRTEIPLTVQSVDRDTGTFVQLLTPAQGIMGGLTVRVALTPENAREVALALLEETCVDAESAALFVVNRFGLEIVGDLRPPRPKLPTKAGSLVRYGSSQKLATRVESGWVDVSTGHRIRIGPLCDVTVVLDAEEI